MRIATAFIKTGIVRTGVKDFRFFMLRQFRNCKQKVKKYQNDIACQNECCHNMHRLIKLYLKFSIIKPMERSLYVQYRWPDQTAADQK